jgi:hypothetical protein
MVTAILLLIIETKRDLGMKYYYGAEEENLYGVRTYGINIFKEGKLVEHISDVCCEERAIRELCDRLTEEALEPEQIYDVLEDLLSELYDL